MKSENFVTIQGWMCNELELKGNDLLIYALIYGFSQDGESAFSGSRNYIADTFNISKPTVDKALQDLLNKNYIIKYESKDINAPNSYAVNIQVVKKLYMSSKETLLGGSKETLLNNNSKQTNKEKTVVSKDTTIEFQFGKSKPKKESLYTSCANLIRSKSTDEAIQKSLFDWLNMLLEKYRSRGKVLYVNVFKGKLNMLDKYDKKDWREIIEYNLQKGYEGFYPISYSSYSDLKNKPWEKDVSCDTYTPEELEELRRIDAEREAQGMRTKF